MLFVKYLQEIKYRIFFIIIAFITLFISCYSFSTEILIIFIKPLEGVLSKKVISFIFTNMSDAFVTNIYISFLLSFVLCSPIFLAHCLFYLMPGLFLYERKQIIQLFLLSFFCFIYINILSYYLLLPSIWEFFLKFQLEDPSNLIQIKFEGRINEYITLICHFLFFFNILFQFPILMYILIKFGVIKLEILVFLRKIIYFNFLVLSAMLSPPDILSQILIFIPIFIVYEISLVLLHINLNYKIN